MVLERKEIVIAHVADAKELVASQECKALFSGRCRHKVFVRIVKEQVASSQKNVHTVMETE
jgi:hypothetical protein